MYTEKTPIKSKSLMGDVGGGDLSADLHKKDPGPSLFLGKVSVKKHKWELRAVSAAVCVP